MSEPIHLALLGDPVAHSRSPVIQRAALREAGIPGDYIAITADVKALERAFAQLRDGSLTGLNVTMPLKEPAFGLCDELTSLAATAKSVNTLRSRDRNIEGHTTDAVAFHEILADRNRFPLDLPVLILGSGGSARAALSISGSRDTYISARSPEKASALADEFGAAGVIRWGLGVEGAVVVNATPIGMQGERLPAEITAAAGGLVDLPYGPKETPAVHTASGSGRPFVDGVEFLARQARGSFEWWTGKPVDLGPLVRAARNV